MALTLLRLGGDYDAMDFEGKKGVDIALENDYKDIVGAVM